MKRRRKLSEAQKLAMNRNTSKGQIMFSIGSLTHILSHGHITKDEAEKLKVVKDFLQQIIKEWKPTI
jgi:hypothetical protein